MDWYLMALRRWRDFGGRSRRKEYWMFTLINFVFYVGASILDLLTGLPLFALVYMLAMLIPSTALFVRRMHDIGKSGWWMLLALVPVIGTLVLIYFLVQDSKPDNKYGPNPKGVIILD